MPTEQTGLAGRYAAALYDLAEEGRALDAVAEDLRGLRRLVLDNRDLARLVRSPVIGRAEQGRAMVAVLDRAGAHDLTRRFVGTVAANRRLFALLDIIAAFLDQLASRRGEVTAAVASAVALKDHELAALEAALRSAVGRKVSVDLTVDPALMGGLVVRVGSRMVDSSLRSKLQRLQLAMKDAG